MKILKYKDIDPDVFTLQKILKEQGYLTSNLTNVFNQATKDALCWFQATHIGPDKRQLEVDGICGPKTWWALQNPSGPAQANKIPSKIPTGLSEARARVLRTALIEHDRPVKEVPDGSNWGPEIKKYGGQPGWAWCALFVGYCFKQATGEYPAGRVEPSCFNLWKAAEKKGTWRSKDKYSPIPGDIFIMQYKEGGKLTGKGHTGIVLRVSADGRQFNAVEGNCSNTVKNTLREIKSDKLLGFINIWNDQCDFERGILTGNIDSDSLESTR